MAKQLFGGVAVTAPLRPRLFVSPATALSNSRGREWQQLIDEKLMKWLRDSGELEDDGVDPPSGTILRLAIDYAEACRDEWVAPPQSIVPDGSGGIVFERGEGTLSEKIHFWDDGTVEYLQFQGSRLAVRAPMPI